MPCVRSTCVAVALAACLLATPALARDTEIVDEIALAPDFALPDVNGATHRLAAYRGRWVVLEWVNYDCPFVKKQYDASHRRMQGLQAHYAARGVVWLSICSSAAGKQGHMTPASGTQWLARLGARPAALLLDPDGAVGRRYGAKTTPDLRIIDPRGHLVYSGAIDDVRSQDPADVPRARNYVQLVLDAVLAGAAPPVRETRPYGCSVKYGPAPAALAPDFTLPAIAGGARTLSAFRGRWVVLEWVNHGCPFVKKHYDARHRNMQRLQRTYRAKGVAWLSICSSAPGKQGHMAPAAWRATTSRLDAAPAAVLLDENGRVGRLYGARTTPEIRIIDPRGAVVYAGAIDDKPSMHAADVAGATNYVTLVLDAVLAGQPAPVATSRPYGCSVKYAR